MRLHASRQLNDKVFRSVCYFNDLITRWLRISAQLLTSLLGSDYILPIINGFWRIVSEDFRYFGTIFLLTFDTITAIFAFPDSDRCSPLFTISMIFEKISKLFCFDRV